MARETIFQNTVGMSSEVLRQKASGRSGFGNMRIIGGLYKTKYQAPKHFDMTTYSVPEMINVLDKMERIENGINPCWTPMERAFYLHTTLANGIECTKQRGKGGLRALVDGRATPEDFSVVYKELCDRQGIPCECVRGVIPGKIGKTSWNVIKVDDRTIPVNVAAESYNLREAKGEAPNFFGQESSRFPSRYVPDRDERIGEYSYLTPQTVANMYASYRRQKTEKRNGIMHMQRTCGSRFLATKVGVKKVDGVQLNKYALCEEKNGIMCNPSIAYTENDITTLTPEQYSYLFAETHIADRCTNKAGYLGEIQKRSDDLTVIRFDSRVASRFEKDDTVTLVREDGTRFALQDMGREGPMHTKKYCFYEFHQGKNGGIHMSDAVLYSHQDLLALNNSRLTRNALANKLFTRGRIVEAVRENAGYIGGLRAQQIYREDGSPGQSYEVETDSSILADFSQRRKGQDIEH